MTDTQAAPRRRGRPSTTLAAEGGAEVQSLDRAMSLLKVLADADGMPLSEIARRAEIPASTVHRLLATLQKRRLVSHDQETGLWTVGVGLFRVGSAYLRIRKLPEIGRPVMRRLLQETQETVNLAMFDGPELVVVAQAEAHAPLRAFFRLGARLPLHASAAGKAILAAAGEDLRSEHLARLTLSAFTPRTLIKSLELQSDVERAAARGFALDEEEFTPGMRAVAAAVLNEWREPVGAISLSAPTVRMPSRRAQELGERVREAAGELTRLYAGMEPRETNA